MAQPCLELPRTGSDGPALGLGSVRCPSHARPAQRVRGSAICALVMPPPDSLQLVVVAVHSGDWSPTQSVLCAAGRATLSLGPSSHQGYQEPSS